MKIKHTHNFNNIFDYFQLKFRVKERVSRYGKCCEVVEEVAACSRNVLIDQLGLQEGKEIDIVVRETRASMS